MEPSKAKQKLVKAQIHIQTLNLLLQIQGNISIFVFRDQKGQAGRIQTQTPLP